MSLIDALKAFDPDVKLQVARPSWKALERTEYKLERMADGLDQISIKASHDVIDEVVAALSGGREPNRRSAKLVCMGGLTQLSEQPDGKALVSTLLDQIVSSASRPLLKALLIGYLRFDGYSSWLSKKVFRILQRRQPLLPGHWQRRVAEFNLLGEPQGEFLAERILADSEETPAEVLKRAGLGGVLASGGMAKAAYKHICLQLGEGHQEQTMARFWAYAEQRPMPFESDIVHYCHALLNPYVLGQTNEGNRHSIQHFILSAFGDPRLHPGKYAAVPEVHLNLLHRWLTQDSMELLMEVVKRSNDTAHWQDRSVFWNHYIENDLVSEAWVAFGPNAHFQAKRLVKQGVLERQGAFASLKSGNVQPMHSVIMMRIGDLVITEWTHDGKVRIYRKDNPHAPRFYRREYDPYLVRRDVHADLAQSHYSGWQDKVAHFIHEETGAPGPKARTSRRGKHSQRARSSGGEAKVRTSRSRPNSLSKSHERDQFKCRLCGTEKALFALNSNGVCGLCALGSKART